MKSRGRIVIVLLFVVAVLAGLSAFWAPRYFEAAWFLEDIASGTGDSSWKKLHKEPKVALKQWTVGGRANEGDLYTPDGSIHGRLIFVPGLIADARKDERVVAFAKTLARAGFVTLVPQTTAFDNLQARPDDIEAVIDAVLWLNSENIDGKGPGPVGIAALSYMSGPALLAASREPARDKVSFVFFIGGYHSMTDVIRFVTTRNYRLAESDPWSTSPPADYAVWAFLKANAQGVDDPQERETLEAIAAQKLVDPNADVGVLAGTLKGQGKAVYDLVLNRDPDRVDALIAALPPLLKAGLDALDPSRQDLSAFQGEAILVHGRDDPFIPAVESEKLAAALGARTHLYVLDQVTHVEVNRPGSTWDQLDMLFAARRLLSQRN